jgi:hypothetical protein
MTRFLCAALLSCLAFAGCAVGADPGDRTSELAGVQPPAPRDILPRPPHCIAPWGIDWSVTLGVTDVDVVSPFCTQVMAGDRYIPEVLWITNTPTGVEGHPVVYPDGYFPTSSVPMTDFLHKLERVRYVVQPGGQEVVYSAPGIEKALIVSDLFAGSDQFPPAEMVLPVTALLGRLPALPVGSYRASIHFVMTAEHCDGNHADRANNCLPAGDSLVLSRAFDVVP